MYVLLAKSTWNLLSADQISYIIYSKCERIPNSQWYLKSNVR